MTLGFLIIVMVYTGLGALSDFDKLLGCPEGKRLVPAVSLTFDLLIGLWAALLIYGGRPW